MREDMLRYVLARRAVSGIFLHSAVASWASLRADAVSELMNDHALILFRAVMYFVLSSEIAAASMYFLKYFPASS